MALCQLAQTSVQQFQTFRRHVVQVRWHGPLGQIACDQIIVAFFDKSSAHGALGQTNMRQGGNLQAAHSSRADYRNDLYTVEAAVRQPAFLKDARSSGTRDV